MPPFFKGMAAKPLFSLLELCEPRSGEWRFWFSLRSQREPLLITFLGKSNIIIYQGAPVSKSENPVAKIDKLSIEN